MTWKARKTQIILVKLEKEAQEREACAVYAPEKFADNYNHPLRKRYI